MHQRKKFFLSIFGATKRNLIFMKQRMEVKTEKTTVLRISLLPCSFPVKQLHVSQERKSLTPTL